MASLVTVGFSIVMTRRSLALATESYRLAHETAEMGEAKTRVDVFRGLRGEFSKFRSELPLNPWALKELPKKTSEMIALERYWHQSFDEWFITKKLQPKMLKSLWDEYYEAAIGKMRDSPGAVAALLHAQEGTNSNIDKEFIEFILSAEFQLTEAYEAANKLAKGWDDHFADLQKAERNAKDAKDAGNAGNV